MKRAGTTWGIAALAVGGLLLIGVSGATAQTYRPNKTSDHAPNGCTPSDCTLREAVIAANDHAGSDKIVLKPGKVYKRSALGTTEDLSVDGDLDVLGALRVETPKFVRTRHGRRAAKPAIIDANDNERHFNAFSPLTIVRLVLRNADGTESGGSIYATDALKVYSSQISGNHTSIYGAAIHFNSGSDTERMLVSHTLIKDNHADSQSGGFYMDGPGKIVDSAIKNNTSGSDSGGVHIHSDTEIVRTTISGNASDGRGGGIYNDGALLRINESTISGNRVNNTDEPGGGIYLADNTIITNSTISGNRAPGPGGGILLESSYILDLNGVTIVRNRADTDSNGDDAGGGLVSTGGGEADIQNTIVALNTVGGLSTNIDCYGTFDSGGSNLLGQIGGGCTGLEPPDDLIGGALKLGPLKNNGGPTKTVALLKGSRAINHGGDGALGKDQRGKRKRGQRDIGAFEYKGKN